MIMTSGPLSNRPLRFGKLLCFLARIDSINCPLCRWLQFLYRPMTCLNGIFYFLLSIVFFLNFTG